MANITVSSSGNDNVNAGNRVSVRTSSGRVYVFSTKTIGASSIAMNKGNQDGEPTSFSEVDTIGSLSGLAQVGGAIAIDSNDLIHCIYYHISTDHGGVLAIRYVTFDTSDDTFGTPESVAVLDDDSPVHTHLGIAIDANDNLHVIWNDALTDMGTTTRTAWYSNKTSGSWRTRVSVQDSTSFAVFAHDIMIGEPTSSVGADRPIIVTGFSTQINAHYGNALDASAFTTETDITGSIIPDTSGTLDHLSMTIDSNGKITIAFGEDTTFDLMIIEHLASSAWSSWETPVDVDTSTNYLVPSIAIIGTDRYIFVEDSTNSDINLWKVTTVLGFFDANVDLVDDGNSWNNDTNVSDGSISTFADSTGVGSANSLDVKGTNAPASGGTIKEVQVRIFHKVSTGTGNALVDTPSAQTLAALVLDKTTEDWTDWEILSTPTGGWTWAKVQTLETGLVKNSSGTMDVHKIEFRVYDSEEETADADLPNVGTFENVKVKWAIYPKKVTVYEFDGTVTDPSSDWTNDSNVADGSESTSATSSVAASNYIEIDGTTAPSSGPTITKVSFSILTQGSTSSQSGNAEIRDGGTLLGSASDFDFDFNVNKRWKSMGPITPPGGGWTWAKIQGLEIRIRENSGSVVLDVFKVKLNVETDEDQVGLNDLDYVFESSGSIFYNTFAVATGLALVEVVTTATVAINEASEKFIGLLKNAATDIVGLIFSSNLGLRKTTPLDTIGLTESGENRLRIMVRTITTSIVGLVSAINLGLRKTAPLDTVDINEASERLGGILKNVTTATVGLISTVNLGIRKTVSSIVDLVESGENRLLELVRFGDDTVDINEDSNRLGGLIRNITTSIVGLVSAVNLGLRKTVSSVVDLSESINLGLRKTVSDIVDLIEASEKILTGAAVIIKVAATAIVGLVESANLGLRKTISDIVDINEARERLVGLVRIIDNIVDINEDSNRLMVIGAKFGNDIMGIISAVNLGLRKTVSDIVDINEARERVLGILKNATTAIVGLISTINLGIRKTTPLDTVGITESGENRLLTLVRNTATAIVGLVSTVNLGLRKTINDIVELNEVSEKVKQIIQNVATDIVEIIEGTPIRLLGIIQIATTSIVGLVSTVNLGLRKTVSSVVELTETKNLGIRKTLNDIVDINELSNRLMVIGAKIINTIVDINVPAELVNLAHRKNVNDIVDLNEDSNRLGGLIRVITTSIVGILETANLGLRKTVALSTIGINELSNRLMSIGAKIINTIVDINVPLEKINLAHRKNINTTVELNESSEKLRGVVKVATQAVVGLVSATNLGLRKTATLATIGIIESRNRLVGLIRNLPSTIGLTEARNRLRTLVRNITTTVEINEASERLKAIGAKVIDDIVDLIESSNKLVIIPAILKTISDTIGLTEFVNFLLKRPNREVTGISLINISVEGISIINTSIEGISLVNASAVGISL